MKKNQLCLKQLTLNRETVASLSDAETAKGKGAQMPTGDSVEYGGCSYVPC